MAGTERKENHGLIVTRRPRRTKKLSYGMILCCSVVGASVGPRSAHYSNIYSVQCASGSLVGQRSPQVAEAFVQETDFFLCA